MATANTKKVTDAADEAIDKVADKAAEVEEKVREKADEARDKVEQQAVELSAAVCHYVNEKPIASLGIAFVAGLVASSLLRR